MCRRFSWTCVLLIISLPLAAEIDYSSYTIEEGKYFSVFIEQGGETAAVRNGRVEIGKTVFALVLVMKEPLGVLANFSLDDQMYRGFRRGKLLSEIMDEPDMFMGLAEENFNRRQRIFIDDSAPHYLFFQDQNNHRFDEIYKAGDYFICKRTIGYYALLSAVESVIPIELLAGDTLYISFLYSDYDENWERVELQKEALRIDFD